MFYLTIFRATNRRKRCKSQNDQNGCYDNQMVAMSTTLVATSRNKTGWQSEDNSHKIVGRVSTGSWDHSSSLIGCFVTIATNYCLYHTVTNLVDQDKIWSGVAPTIVVMVMACCLATYWLPCQLWLLFSVCQFTTGVNHILSSIHIKLSISVKVNWFN
jgi:hypothetical protein